MKAQRAFVDRPIELASVGHNLLTVHQLSRVLGVHPQTTRALWKEGIIPGIKLGYRTLRFNLATVLSVLDKLENLEAPRKCAKVGTEAQEA